MNTLRSNFMRFTTLGVGLALFTALTYVLIALKVLGVGDPQAANDGGPIIYVAAGCYLLGGLLILLRNRWLLLVGAFFNALVIVFFFNMYQARPEIMLSPGGLLSKSAQILLEISLLLALVVGWKRKK
jgi:hypothetical protein